MRVVVLQELKDAWPAAIAPGNRLVAAGCTHAIAEVLDARHDHPRVEVELGIEDIERAFCLRHHVLAESERDLLTRDWQDRIAGRNRHAGRHGDRITGAEHDGALLVRRLDVADKEVDGLDRLLPTSRPERGIGRPGVVVLFRARW